MSRIRVAFGLLLAGCASAPSACPCHAHAPPALESAPSALRPEPAGPAVPRAHASPKTESEPAASDSAGAFGPEPPGVGWIEVYVGAEHRLVSGTCQETWSGSARPSARILDPETAAPRFVLDSCGADDVYFDIVGTSVRLPGKVDGARLRFIDPDTGQEWKADVLELDVTEFGAVGGPVRGHFTGTMSARLNREPVPIRGRFVTERAADRFAP